MKQIPFVDFPKGKEMDSRPPDGIYATISHNTDPFEAFPWRTTIYRFKGDVTDKLGGGSNAGDVLSRIDVAKVFLIGLDAAERAEVNKTLAEWNIELIPDPAVEAEKKRARDSFGPGFPLPV